MAFLLVLALAAAPSVGAQSVEELSGSPVDIHPGTCDDPTPEPAHLGGELGPDTLDGLQDDELSVIGLLDDPDAGARGVDLDRDGTLSGAGGEIIGGTNEDIPVAWADATFDDAVDFDQESIVVVHADTDDGYGTIVACGTINDAEPDEEGRRIVPLSPVGDYTAVGFSVLPEDGQSLNTYMFEPGEVPEATPDPLADAPQGPFPIALHAGSCSDWTPQPTHDLGNLELTNVGAEGMQQPGDTEGEVTEAAAEVGPVYMSAAETEFLGFELIEEGPFVVVVHQSPEEFGTPIACGPVMEFYYGDTQTLGDMGVAGTDVAPFGNMLVVLLPMDDSNFTGFVLLGGDARVQGGGITTYMWQAEQVGADDSNDDTDEQATPQG